MPGEKAFSYPAPYILLVKADYLIHDQGNRFPESPVELKKYLVVLKIQMLE
jgi:hypothetical protein